MNKLLLSFFSFFILNSNFAFAETESSNSASLQWASFELGATRVYTSNTVFADGPQLAFTPKFKIKKNIQWFELAPRLDVQFNKDVSGKVNALYSLGLQGKISLGTSFYVAPEVAIWTTNELTKTVSYASTGLWGGYKLNKSEGLMQHFEYVALGYRRHYSTNEFNQLSLVVGLNFN